MRIEIPESIGVQRDLRSNRRHIDDSPLDPTDLAQYDRTTLFYDVFFNTANNRLYFIGPPLLNLAKILFPVGASLNGKPISFQIRHYFRKRFVVGFCPVDSAAVNPDNKLTLDFNGVFSETLEIPRNSAQPNRRILTTLQKNNRPEWIKEWVNYYKNRFNVDEVILYDNGSDNIAELQSQLDNIVIENWDFPFGIIKSHYNKFCQYGSLNHCRLKYGNDSMIYNFDIDEILVSEPAWIEQQMQTFNILRFDSYQVPLVTSASEHDSYGDYTKRERSARGGGQKYIYRDSAVVANNIHIVRTLDNEFAHKLQRQMLRLFRKLKKIPLFKSITINLAEWMTKTRDVDLSRGYFLHYTGITTNWKIYYDRLDPERIKNEVVDINSDHLATIRSMTGKGS